MDKIKLLKEEDELFFHGFWQLEKGKSFLAKVISDEGVGFYKNI